MYASSRTFDQHRPDRSEGCGLNARPCSWSLTPLGVGTICSRRAEFQTMAFTSSEYNGGETDTCEVDEGVAASVVVGQCLCRS